MGNSSGYEIERSVIRVYDDAGNVIETQEEGHSRQTIHARQAKPALKRSGH